jgi:hypothetical protein
MTGKSHRTRKARLMINKTFKKEFGVVKSTSKKGLRTVRSTSKKYMPAVKTGLEGLGTKVTKTASKAAPILKKTGRDLLGVVGIKSKGKSKSKSVWFF